MKNKIRTTVAACALVLVSAGASFADSDFYKGKQIKLVSSTEPGLVYDIYSRLLARHMPRHIPGNPSIIVQNMPGAGGIKATNYAARRDCDCRAAQRNSDRAADDAWCHAIRRQQDFLDRQHHQGSTRWLRLAHIAGAVPGRGQDERSHHGRNRRRDGVS
jgi:hypothetical protein